MHCTHQPALELLLTQGFPAFGLVVLRLVQGSYSLLGLQERCGLSALTLVCGSLCEFSKPFFLQPLALRTLLLQRVGQSLRTVLCMLHCCHELLLLHG